jgi:hypothetical protein
MVVISRPTRSVFVPSFAWLMNTTPSPSVQSFATRSRNSEVIASHPLPYSKSEACTNPVRLPASPSMT